MAKLLKCKKCGHIWKSHMDVLPIQCPFCKSVTWNEQPQPGVNPSKISPRAADAPAQKPEAS